MLPDPIAVTSKVAAVLEKLSVPYFVGGSLASALYGMVRTTHDADIIAKLELEQLPFFVSSLEAEFYIDEEMIRDAVRRRSSFNIIHRESTFKVDIFIPQPSPFQQSQMARAQKTNFSKEPEINIRFATPEDIILAKLDWYRMGGEVSERQWLDIRGVLMTRQNELDLDYLRYWSEELQLSQLLDRALREIS